MNAVRPGSFLTLHYRLTGPRGDALIDTFSDKPATLSVGGGELAPAMEARLIGLEEGAHVRFDLAPGEAFGERSPELVQRVSLALLHRLGEPDERYAVGDVVQLPAPDGRGQLAAVVREVQPDSVLLDFNHPLAGEAVGFEVQLIGVL